MIPDKLYRVEVIRGGSGRLRCGKRGGQTFSVESAALERAHQLHREGIETRLWSCVPIWEEEFNPCIPEDWDIHVSGNWLIKNCTTCGIGVTERVR